MEANNLKGLTAEGFTDSSSEFDKNTFDSLENIDKIRSVIKTYLRKTDSINYENNSYGLKHVMEKHLGFYVSNGELIYAMHLEGFEIVRKNINCCFNVSKSGIRLLKNSNDIKETLGLPLFYTADDYTKRKKSFLKYKYTFNALIDCRFNGNAKYKRHVYTTIALELGESTKDTIAWLNIFNSDEKEIPAKTLKQLLEIFNLKDDQHLNPKVK